MSHDETTRATDREASAERDERILVRAPNWAGDVVMATPALRALRAARPRAWIALHIRAALAPLVAGSPSVDAVLPLAEGPGRAPALWRDARALRAGRFDLGICLPDSFSAALRMRLGGVRRVAGYRTQGRGPLLDVAPPPPPRWTARERHVLGLLAAIGIPPQGTALELHTTGAEEAAASALLAEAGLGPGDAIAALAPGASYGPSKRWPAESFAAVGDALAAAGARVVVIGAPDEGPLGRRVREAMRAPAVDLCGRLDLGVLKAVLRRARLLVCNDAGARHVAVAFGVPAVVLFGPTALEKTDCNLERVTALFEDVACRPCYRRTCPIDHRCLAGLAPARVEAAVLPLLEARAPAGRVA